MEIPSRLLFLFIEKSDQKQVPYLGVVFENRVMWSEHVEFFEGWNRKSMYAFRQISEIVVHKETIFVYYAYI